MAELLDFSSNLSEMLGRGVRSFCTVGSIEGKSLIRPGRLTKMSREKLNDSLKAYNMMITQKLTKTSWEVNLEWTGLLKQLAAREAVLEHLNSQADGADDFQKTLLEARKQCALEDINKIGKSMEEFMIEASKQCIPHDTTSVYDQYVQLFTPSEKLLESLVEQLMFFMDTPGAWAIFDEMIKEGHNPSPQLCSRMLHHTSKLFDFEKATKVFHRMVEHGMRLESSDFSVYFTLALHTLNVDHCKDVLDMIRHTSHTAPLGAFYGAVSDKGAGDALFSAIIDVYKYALEEKMVSHYEPMLMMLFELRLRASNDLQRRVIHEFVEKYPEMAKEAKQGLQESIISSYYSIQEHQKCLAYYKELFGDGKIKCSFLPLQRKVMRLAITLHDESFVKQFFEASAFSMDQFFTFDWKFVFDLVADDFYLLGDEFDKMMSELKSSEIIEKIKVHAVSRSQTVTVEKKIAVFKMMQRYIPNEIERLDYRNLQFLIGKVSLEFDIEVASLLIDKVTDVGASKHTKVLELINPISRSLIDANEIELLSKLMGILEQKGYAVPMRYSSLIQKSVTHNLSSQDPETIKSALSDFIAQGNSITCQEIDEAFKVIEEAEGKEAVYEFVCEEVSNVQSFQLEFGRSFRAVLTEFKDIENFEILLNHFRGSKFPFSVTSTEGLLICYAYHGETDKLVQLLDERIGTEWQMSAYTFLMAIDHFTIHDMKDKAHFIATSFLEHLNASEVQFVKLKTDQYDICIKALSELEDAKLAESILERLELKNHDLKVGISTIAAGDDFWDNMMTDPEKPDHTPVEATTNEPAFWDSLADFHATTVQQPYLRK